MACGGINTIYNRNTVVLSFKTQRNIKDIFKETTRNNGTTMQIVLESFVNSYNDSPDKYAVESRIVEPK